MKIEIIKHTIFKNSKEFEDWQIAISNKDQVPRAQVKIVQMQPFVIDANAETSTSDFNIGIDCGISIFYWDEVEDEKIN